MFPHAASNPLMLIKHLPITNVLTSWQQICAHVAPCAANWATSASVMTHVQRNNGLGAQYGGFSISRQRRILIARTESAQWNQSAWRNLNVPLSVPRAAPIGGSLSFLLSYYKFNIGV